jgi:hypothetical protein
MRADFGVLLDACVLIPMPLADTLLRMAEAPRLYLPKWSQIIMDEVTHNLIEKWRVDPARARRREQEIRRHFPEAWVESFEPLIVAMTNDPKDRHVLAAAVRSHCELIVTYITGAISRRLRYSRSTSKSRDHPHSYVACMTSTLGLQSTNSTNRPERSESHLSDSC